MQNEKDAVAEGQAKYDAYRGAETIPAGGVASATPGVPHDYGKADVAPASVGRIVHLYTNVPGKQFNGQGAGPYAALVVQTFPDSPYVNLQVFPPCDEPYAVGSVAHAQLALERGYGTYWEWPPRV